MCRNNGGAFGAGLVASSMSAMDQKRKSEDVVGGGRTVPDREVVPLDRSKSRLTHCNVANQPHSHKRQQTTVDYREAHRSSKLDQAPVELAIMNGSRRAARSG